MMEWEENIEDAVLYRRIENALFAQPLASSLTSTEMISVVRRVFYSFRGLDALQPLVDDPAITEIMVNSHEEIFIERGGNMEQLTMQFESRDKLEDVIQSVVSRVNRVVNESSPIVDARLSDGSRVHIVLPPVALKGPTVTIRKFPAKPMTIESLVHQGALSNVAAEFLQILVRAKYNLFISGGTGSGKTTFLNALSQYIPSTERVITIEDAAELQILTVPNLVALETRNANTEGKGAMAMKDLIRAALRMRPNRIVVGEVRGGEALDMLQAMNTGHDGSLSTGHANGARDMLSRLETMVLSGTNMPLPVIRQQIASALDVIVHLARLRDGSRKVMEIAEVEGIKGGEIVLSPLYVFEEHEERDGVIYGQLEQKKELLHRWKLKMAGMRLPE
ncbi:CpaF family protein [Paenibacillus sp. ACRRX]|uniref:CpaF family protein n=1 Tax=unclassified Paenibacillus TaxID=185978 RepID=UPI001EF3F637|nr:MULTISPECIES: CpaF family protein [unclassified Paenibacillus]MCG7410017.1 CpaF family protein [Paenibacillus sp. ACRRX]MDK8182918.1 CpaF family protein [Paenibacillus sp. UMB4589-SE434]